MLNDTYVLKPCTHSFDFLVLSPTSNIVALMSENFE